MLAVSLTKMAKIPLFRILVAQTSLTVFATIVCLMASKVAGISALLAGLSGVLPSVIMVLVSMKPIMPGQTGLGQVLRGETSKIALTIALVASIFALAKPLNIVVFFAIFILMQVCQVVVPLIDANRMVKRSLN